MDKFFSSLVRTYDSTSNRPEAPIGLAVALGQGSVLTVTREEQGRSRLYPQSTYPSSRSRTEVEAMGWLWLRGRGRAAQIDAANLPDLILS